jgi:hypothetical protein
MKYLFRSLMALLFLASVPFAASASHFVGSQLSYQAVPGLPGYYLVTMNLYRDCGGIDFPTNIDVDVASSCGTLPPLQLTLNQITDISGMCAGTPTECNPVGIGSIQPGVEEYFYTGLIDMSSAPRCADWTFSHGSSARNPGIVNVANSSAAGYYIDAILNTGTVNSPIANTTPVAVMNITPYVCINDTATFNPQAVDPDGDSLVYSLAPAYDVVGTSVTYAPGYSFTQPFGISVISSLDTQTGLFRVIPNQSGAFVVDIKIEEYRTINGVVTKVGTSQQDMQFQVINCAATFIQAGNTLSINNGNTTAGASETIPTLPNQSININIPASSQASVQLVMSSSNHQTIAPGSSFTTSGTGSQITGHFNWMPDASQVRSQPYFIHYYVNDNSCPIPNNRYGVLRVLVTNSILSAAPAVTAAELLLPTILQKGETLVLPVELQGSKLQVFDQTGKLVYNQNSYQNSFRANQLAAGTYLYQVTPVGEKEPISAKLMIGQ